MYRKLILIPFSILLGMNILNYITNIFTELFTNYLLSLSVLGLGTIFYPFDLKFKHKADYIFPTLLGYTIFNIANLFLFQDFSIKINYINKKFLNTTVHNDNVVLHCCILQFF